MRPRLPRINNGVFGALLLAAALAMSGATDAVMDSPNCIAIDEAENRLHVQKAVMAAALFSNNL